MTVLTLTKYKTGKNTHFSYWHITDNITDTLISTIHKQYEVFDNIDTLNAPYKLADTYSFVTVAIFINNYSHCKNIMYTFTICSSCSVMKCIYWYLWHFFNYIYSHSSTYMAIAILKSFTRVHVLTKSMKTLIPYSFVFVKMLLLKLKYWHLKFFILFIENPIQAERQNETMKQWINNSSIMHQSSNKHTR